MPKTPSPTHQELKYKYRVGSIDAQWTKEPNQEREHHQSQYKHEICATQKNRTKRGNAIPSSTNMRYVVHKRQNQERERHHSQCKHEVRGTQKTEPREGAITTDTNSMHRQRAVSWIVPQGNPIIVKLIFLGGEHNWTRFLRLAVPWWISARCLYFPPLSLCLLTEEEISCNCWKCKCLE